MSVERKILKSSHTPYFWSNRFIPKPARDDIFKLYSFIRTVGGFIDADPVAVDNFEYIEHRWQNIKQDLAKKHVPAPIDDSICEHVLANIAYLTHRHSFDPAWVDAYLQSMRWDLQKHQYRTLKDTVEYTYGSAEVVGLMAARIIGLPEESMKAVRLQARAMQYITLLRDMGEDEARGRIYFPANDVKKYGLKNLTKGEAYKKPGMFADFIHAELLRYAQWQADANDRFAHLPRRLRVPLQTAIDSQTWTAQQLKYNPLIVFEKKVMPSRQQIVRLVAQHTISR